MPVLLPRMRVLHQMRPLQLDPIAARRRCPYRFNVSIEPWAHKQTLVERLCRTYHCQAATNHDVEKVMQVREVMSTDCQTVKMHDSLRAAAEHMRDDDIGMLLVEDDNGIRGILTDRDIAVRAVASGVGPDEELASCITEELVACHEDDALEEALRLMEQEQVRRLLVRDANDRPVGVLAQADVARAMGRSELVGEALQEISQPGGDHSQH